MVIGLYAFLTFEETAIATVPPAETVVAFVPATPTPTLTPTITPTPTQTPVPTATAPSAVAAPPPDEETLLSLMVIPHPLEGREDCLMCHAEGGTLPYPPDHVGRPSSTCLVCHATTEAEEHLPATVQHELEGRDDCLMCHAVDLLPESHKTGEFSNDDCLLCHMPGDAETAAAGTADQSAAEAGRGGDVSFAGDVLPLLEANCVTCHGDMALGGLQATDYETLMAGGQSGSVVVGGSPDESLIVAKMDEEHPSVLTGDDLQALIDWIAAGAEND
jgi:hypothetical protein